jgi:hypothetical protein
MNAAEQSHEPRHERRQAVSAHVNAVVSAKMGARHWMTVPSMVSVGGCGVGSRLMQTASLKVFMVFTRLHIVGEKTAILGCARRLA